MSDVEFFQDKNGQTVGQSKTWKNFYETAWAFRSAFIEELIRSGETNTKRIIELLAAKERKYKLNYNLETGSARFEKRAPEELMLPSGLPLLRMTSFQGNFFRLPSYLDVNLHNFVTDYFDEHGPFDAIVELGCGFGHNLYRIYYEGGPRVPYFGGEFTASGVALAQKLATLEKSQTFEFFRFDHLNPDLSMLPKLRRVLIFTMHTIEQVHRIGLNLLRTIASVAQDVHCIHLEPFGFQVKILGDVSQKQKEAFEKHGWNVNLADTLKQAHEQGVIHLDYSNIDMFPGVDPYNQTSLAVWRNKR